MCLRLTGFLFFLLTAAGLSAQETSRPNIVLILADDLGWTDLSCYGSTFYETVHLDKLAAGGIRFTQNYASSPVCSPTRAALLTGKNPVKTGVTDWIRGRQEGGKARPWEKYISPATAYQLDSNEITLASYARSAGYKTFFAGKWHLGEEEKDWPEAKGFAINKGGWSSGAPTKKVNDTTGGFFPPYGNPRLPDGPHGEYLTDRLTNECIDFINAQHQQPFFLFYSLYAVHNPLQAPRELIKKYEEKRKKLNPGSNPLVKDEDWMKNEAGWKRRIYQDHPVYAAMIENMDGNIGRILEALKAAGLDKNTLVIFTADNGGLSTAEGSPTSNSPLRGGKGWLYEGGLRVPLIIQQDGLPGAGTESDLPVITSDLYPTLAGLMNPLYTPAKETEGRNIFSMLARPQPYRNRTLIWHYPHYSNQGGKPGSAIRQGNYKLICDYESGKTELYDLRTDISESVNLAGKEKRVARRLQRILTTWLKRNAPDSFRVNPLYKGI